MRSTAAPLLAAVCLAASIPSAALEFEPAITLGITHTDNVGLTTVDEESETVYRAEPGFSLSHETTRVSATADYLMQAFRYQDLGQSEIFHQYDAKIRAALVPDMFFLEVGGDRTQTILDPELTIPQSNLPISGNRQDRDEYYVSPSFQYAIGSALTAQADYRNSWVDYGDGNLRGINVSSENRDARFSLDNYRRGSGITWALRYDWRRTDYDEGFQPFEYQQAAAELGVWLNGTTRVFASGGKESAWDQPLDPALEDEFWEAGFAHQVGERLRAEFAAGERSFGSSWRGNLELGFRRGSLAVTYAERPTTESRNRITGSEFLDPLEPGDFLERPGSGQRFVSKRLDWRLGYNLQRTSFSMTVFDEERADRTTASGDPLDDESQQGINASIRYELGARTGIRLRGSWADRELGDRGDSELINAALSVDYSLGARTELSLVYEYDEEDAEAGAGARNYVANSISLFLTRTF